MLTLLCVIAAPPFVLFVYIYLMASSHVRRKQSLEGYPHYEPRSPAGLPPPVWQAFGRDVPRLEALGFSVVGYFYQRAMREDETIELSQYFALLRNDETGDLAQLIEIFARGRATETHIGLCEFSAEFEGGDSLTTLASTQVVTFKPHPRHPVFRFPDVDDPRLLFRAHRALRGRHAPGRASVLPSRGMELASLADAETQVLRWQAEAGYYAYEADGDRFRPTWKGALLMTARQMWVINDLLLARERAAGRATLKSLGLRA